MNYKEYLEISKEIESVYLEMDKINMKFSKKFNISCVSSCNGKCCDDKNVSISPVDLIPLVIELISNNQIEEIQSIIKEKINQPCIFWKYGKCSVYQKRATLCRLFGFSQLKDKHNNSRLSVCKEITNDYSHPLAYSNAKLAVDIQSFSQKINSLVPSWDNTPKPFNEALNYAINNIYTSFLYEK